MTDELCINLNIGNPSIPRVWNRFLINNQFRQDVGDEAYQMRKKAEILKYKNNANNISSAQEYSQRVRGNRSVRGSFANQNNVVTNPNIQNLEQQGNILIFPCDNTIKHTPVEASNVPPSNKVKTLFLDKSIPTPELRVQRTYPTTPSDWRKLNQTKINHYARLNNFFVT